MASLPARQPPGGTGASSPYDVRFSYGGAGPNAGNVNFTYTGPSWFGPLPPMHPIAPPEVAGRAWDFIPGWNLTTQPRAFDLVDFATLRALAESYDPLRLIIERRKDQLTRLPWGIRLRHDGPGKRPKAHELKAADRDRIDGLTAFFKRPDGEHSFRSWFRTLLDDVFVIDAPTLYCSRNRGGDLLALQAIDGATIKPVIDDWGRTPKPIPWETGAPFEWNGRTIDASNYAAEGFKFFQKTPGLIYPPAYQQVLKGLPAVDYATFELVYRPLNLRPGKVYGYSPIEQVFTTVNIALRRQFYQFEYYREGNMPEGILQLPQSWTPDQIQRYQDYWDNILAGNLGQRRHVKFVPGGAGSNIWTPFKEPELKTVFDEWLTRICCFALSYPPTAFVALSNRSIAQQHEQQAEEEGLGPTKMWAVEVLNDIIEAETGWRDIEFAFLEEDEVNQEVQEKILSGYVTNGIYTINQALEKLGEEPNPNPAASTLMVKTANGYVPIEANGIAYQQEKQAALAPKDAPPGAGTADDGNSNDGPDDRQDDMTGDVGKAAGASGKIAFHFVRHGATKMNNATDLSEDRIRSWLDVPLTEEGREQARAAATKLKGKGITVIYASSLERAKETADIIGGELGLQPLYVDGLRPWNLGDFTGKPTKDCIAQIIDYADKKPDEKVPGGESFNSFKKRIFATYHRILSGNLEEKVLTVSHHRVERVWYGWDALGQPPDHSLDLDVFGRRGGPPGNVHRFTTTLAALKGEHPPSTHKMTEGETPFPFADGSPGLEKCGWGVRGASTHYADGSRKPGVTDGMVREASAKAKAEGTGDGSGRGESSAGSGGGSGGGSRSGGGISTPQLTPGHNPGGPSNLPEVRSTKHLFEVTYRAGTSSDFRKQVDEHLDRLSHNVKVTLATGGMKVTAARSVVEAVPSLKGQQPRGWSAGKTWEHVDGVHSGGSENHAVAAETRLNSFTNKPELSNRTGQVVLHEVGHGFDQAGHDISSSHAFMEAYNKDVAGIPAGMHGRLGYFLQSGRAGPKEAFAELFALAHGAAHADHAVGTHFPRAYEYVKRRIQ